MSCAKGLSYFPGEEGLVQSNHIWLLNIGGKCHNSPELSKTQLPFKIPIAGHYSAYTNVRIYGKDWETRQRVSA